MNDSSLHPLARDYLKRLKKAAANLPRARHNELIEKIESQLSEALPAGASEAKARSVLERLGEPEQIIAEASTGQAPARAGIREWLAVSLLLFGGFALIIGWFVGAVLLWGSRIWTTRDKLIGTLLVPGGLLPAFILFAAGVQTCKRGFLPATRTHPARSITHCTPDISPTLGVVMILALIALIVLPIVGAVYLSRRANGSRDAVY